MTPDLSKVSFGSIAAEDEFKELKKYFLKTSYYKELINDPLNVLVIGRKGSGKSAIRVYIEQDVSKVISLTLNNYPWSIHKKIRDNSAQKEFVYVNSWRYLILIELSKHITSYTNYKRYRFIDKIWWKHTVNANLRMMKRFLKQNYGTLAPSFFELFADRTREVRKINTGFFGVEAPKDDDSYTKLSHSINAVCHDLEELVIKELPGKEEIFVLFDELDLGWDDSQESKDMITGLIWAARDLARSAAAMGKRLHIIVFLRADIFSSLRFDDKNKIAIISLVWNSENLKSLIELRIQSSAGCNWEDIFTQDRLRQQMEVYDYILKRTFLRPRDLIRFCIEAQKKAESQGHSCIEKDDIYEAERPYSREYIKPEFQDETKATCTYLDELFEILTKIKTETLTLNQFVDAYKESSYKEKPAEPMVALQQLIDLSILGIKEPGGKGGGSRVMYSYLADSGQVLSPKEDMIVHPSLKYALQLVERRSHNED